MGIGMKPRDGRKQINKKSPDRMVMIDLTGKWKYRENYGYGITEGELFLKQEGSELSGRIIFTDKPKEEEPYMLQEFLKGRIEEHKVKLDAVEVDIIHSEHEIYYELDSWFGVLVDDVTIMGVSVDAQGVEGNFSFEKVT